jgi:hypothetical protein
LGPDRFPLRIKPTAIDIPATAAAIAAYSSHRRPSDRPPEDESLAVCARAIAASIAWHLAQLEKCSSQRAACEEGRERSR